MDEYFKLMGCKVKDRVTGVRGVVTSLSFDLYGCVQAAVNRGTNKEGKSYDVYWYDVKRLSIKDPIPVMDVPDFGSMKAGDEPGPERKAPAAF